MAYQQDMHGAARRLWEAAVQVEKSQRAVAAYLFGLAAECALKQVAGNLPNGTSEAIQYAHFPQLRAALRSLILGRRHAGLRRIIEHDAFLNQWEIGIRYARKEDINNKPIDEWKEHALKALNLMLGRGL